MQGLDLEAIKKRIYQDFSFEMQTYKNSSFRVLSSDNFEKPVSIIEIFNDEKEEWDVLATLGNISTIKGKAKSKKSTLLSLIVGAAMKDEGIQDKIRCSLPKEKKNILYIDTEQQKYHVGFLMHRVKSLSSNPNLDENLFIYSLRPLSPKERILKVKDYIESIPNLGLVIIDGIRDLVMSINDEVESTEIVSLLMKWSLEFEVHIMNVLHENPTSDKARGHIGTEMMNKSETVVKVEIDSSEEDISVVYPDMCRNKAFSAFPIGIDNFGIPFISHHEVTKKQQRKLGIKDLDTSQISVLLDHVFEQEKERSYENLKTQVQSSFKTIYGNDIGGNQAVNLIKKAKEQALISQLGGKNKPYTQTKLGLEF